MNPPLPAPLRLFAALILAALMLLAPSGAQADPADIDAAARGVVRVVIIGRDGEELFAVSHGTGFAVDDETIVTNAHVVAQAVENERLSIGIVPSDGGQAVFGRLVAVNSRNDLALLQTTSPMRLPPLTISGAPAGDSGSVTSVGYPMNVDRAQGLEEEDIFRAQPPVKATGFLSGRRPSREFDTLLHTAPIARGNSGGPLLDDCGRVVGVNSFGTESSGTDAEFFFAVSNRELLPFLRANGVTPQISAMPCRSLAELDEEEREREERARMAAQARADQQEQALARRRAETLRALEFAILEERDRGLFIALILLMVALGSGGFAWLAHRDGEAMPRMVGGGVALVALALALIAWLSRPGFDEIDTRLEDQLREQMEDEDTGTIDQRLSGNLVCTLDPSRSRVLGADTTDLDFSWSESGCANGRTQYGLTSEGWSRIFVPSTEAAVAVNRFDPAAGEFVIERHLLGSEDMRRARAARGEYAVPQCGAGMETARQLGDNQEAIAALLPGQPNERLVYDCMQGAASPGADPPPSD